MTGYRLHDKQRPVAFLWRTTVLTVQGADEILPDTGTL